jgi:hypothetical protein
LNDTRFVVRLRARTPVAGHGARRNAGIPVFRCASYGLQENAKLYYISVD